MKKIFLVVTLLALSVIVTACSNNDSEDSSNTDDGVAESTELIAYSKWPDDNYVSEGMKEFASKVEESSDGKLTLDVQTGGSLGYEGPELLTAVRDNLVPISDVFSSDVAGDEPLVNITTLPFIMKDFDEAETFYEIARPYFEEVYEDKWNQKILYGTPWPYAGFWTQNKVQTSSDAEGLKMRTYDDNGAKIVTEMGGSPQPLPFSEVYSSLSTGLIDSVLTSSPTAVDGKFWEVLDYHVPTNVTAGHGIVTMNLDEFNKLDDDTQNAVVKAGEEMDDYMWNKVRELDEEMLAKVEEEGITIVEPSEEFMDQLRGIGEDITESWLKDAPPEANEIMEEYNEEIGK